MRLCIFIYTQFYYSHLQIHFRFPHSSYFISFRLSLAVPIYMLQARFCSLLYTNVYGTSHNYENAFNDFTSLPSAFFNAAVAAILWSSLTLLKFNFYRYMPYTCNTCSKSKHICICISVYMCTYISTQTLPVLYVEYSRLLKKKKIKYFAHQIFMLKLTNLFTNVLQTALVHAHLSTHIHLQSSCTWYYRVFVSFWQSFHPLRFCCLHSRALTFHNHCCCCLKTYIFLICTLLHCSYVFVISPYFFVVFYLMLFGVFGWRLDAISTKFSVSPHLIRLLLLFAPLLLVQLFPRIISCDFFLLFFMEILHFASFPVAHNVLRSIAQLLPPCYSYFGFFFNSSSFSYIFFSNVFQIKSRQLKINEEYWGLCIHCQNISLEIRVYWIFYKEVVHVAKIPDMLFTCYSYIIMYCYFCFYAGGRHSLSAYKESVLVTLTRL